jgi:hypothetical protein
MKICTKCRTSKDLSAFYADKSKSDGKHSTCKSCDNEMLAKQKASPIYAITFNAYQREWQRSYRQTPKHKEWRAKALVKQSIRARELKKQVVEHYGGGCACCGVKELCFLSIDHINNDGYLERTGKSRTSGYFMYKKIIAKNYPDNLQVLCFNCNIAKQHNKGICPHRA